MKSYVAKTGDIQRKWYVVDATDKVLGRLASEIAAVLRGKNKPIFTPNIDTGDYVIVINADKVRVTGNKEGQKLYRHHTGFPGGLKSISYEELMAKKPEKAIEIAVKGMLPHNKLGRAMYKKLKVYAGPDHNHEAQQPEVLDI
ncbi:50S ribosomal protein L13 [Miniphocaeibacter halophilus]|uniref:50S ribosomal protein L13 n=1 Tax=Miniphocaeibacter halophilus TaxID=2931922 RepID=A0AC61MP53_9FIRM|nr:50S ribosomal protein L13 [Miniphocaeibacter halophilus]QQK07287.1 50S ribosomal protein L13 [Miniphocaeibacter halophilus]